MWTGIEVGSDSIDVVGGEERDWDVVRYHKLHEEEGWG
jgi:hypothetical protein